MSFVVFLIGVLARCGCVRAIGGKSRRSAQVAELLITNPVGFGIRDLLDENVAHGGRKYMALSDRFPSSFGSPTAQPFSRHFRRPTAEKSGSARLRHRHFFVFQLAGTPASWRCQVPAYVCRFTATLGDWLLGILLFPVELISTTARILSLTVRLWANIFASDLLYVIFLGLLVQPAVWDGISRPSWELSWEYFRQLFRSHLSDFIFLWLIFRPRSLFATFILVAKCERDI